MKFQDVDYKELLENIETFGGFEDSGQRVILRHDTDSDHGLKKSLKMARIEADMGIRAYYYVLHGRDYWGDWPLMLELQNMGHSVGFHNQVVTNAIETFSGDMVLKGKANDYIKDMLIRHISDMRSAGLVVIDTSGHGHPTCYTYGYSNHCVWKGFKKAGDIKQYHLAAFGLKYDAMLIKPGVYISDSGNRWCISKGMLTKDSPEGSFDTIKKIIKDNTVQLNIHPQWWE